MKIRQKLLLENLLLENAIQLQYMAQEFSTSEKTIRNDIQEINCYLTQKRLPCRLEIKKSIAKIECARNIAKISAKQPHSAIITYTV